MRARQPTFEKNPIGYVLSVAEELRDLPPLRGDEAQPELTDFGMRQQPHLWALYARPFILLARSLADDDTSLANDPRYNGIYEKQKKGMALMMLGWGIEIALKSAFRAVLLYEPASLSPMAREKWEKLQHRHDLAGLAGMLLGSLSANDTQRLDILAEFVKWAGRYPAPTREKGLEVLKQAARRQRPVTSHDLFAVAETISRRAYLRMGGAAEATTHGHGDGEQAVIASAG